MFTLEINLIAWLMNSFRANIEDRSARAKPNLAAETRLHNLIDGDQIAQSEKNGTLYPLFIHAKFQDSSISRYMYM